MSFPVNPTLETAVAADSDVPRLAYADWLDEHGDPHRVEFMRVQCRLAGLSPADDGWAELTAREGELAATLNTATTAEAEDPTRFLTNSQAIRKN